MAPAPPPPALHLPYAPGPFRLALGLTTVPEAAWIEIDDRYPEQVSLRRRLVAKRRDEVLGRTVGSEAAMSELRDLLVAHLLGHYPHWFARRGAVLDNALDGTSLDLAGDPLEQVARLVQEDVCLLRPEPDGPVLIAAALCFPSRWRLAEKLGRPLAAIHDPVPGYAAALARPVDRFLSALAAGRIAQRLNWSVLDDPGLFQPTGHGRAAHDPSITPENAIARLNLRVERQTFRRLPRTGAVAFGIRVHVTPLASVVALPGEAARLAAAVRGLPPDMARYKSMSPFRDALLECLDRIAGRVDEPRRAP